MYKIARIEI